MCGYLCEDACMSENMCEHIFALYEDVCAHTFVYEGAHARPCVWVNVAHLCVCVG